MPKLKEGTNYSCAEKKCVDNYPREHCAFYQSCDMAIKKARKNERK
jgi:hypothetical protein